MVSAEPSEQARWFAPASVFGIVAIGWALQIADGFFRPEAIFWIACALVVLAGAAVAARPISFVRFDRPAVRVLALIGLLAQIWQLCTARPGWRMPPELVSLAWFYAGVAALGVLGASVVWGSPRWATPLQIGGLVAVHFALGMWMIRHSPFPFIDVNLFQRDAITALRHGIDPYGITFPDIYGPATYYGPGMSVDGRLQFGFPYPPLSLLLAWPGKLFGGDHRYAQLVAMELAAGLMAFARPKAFGPIAAVLYLTTPRIFFVLQQSWTEPFVVLGLAAVVFVACRSYERRALAVRRLHRAQAIPGLLAAGRAAADAMADQSRSESAPVRRCRDRGGRRHAAVLRVESKRVLEERRDASALSAVPSRRVESAGVVGFPRPCAAVAGGSVRRRRRGVCRGGVAPAADAGRIRRGNRRDLLRLLRFQQTGVLQLLLLRDWSARGRARGVATAGPFVTASAIGTAARRPRLGAEQMAWMAIVATCLVPIVWPGDIPFINDEPLLIARAVDANQKGVPAEAGLLGTYGFVYGPVPIWLYQPLVAVTHDLVVIAVLHTLLMAATTASALWWLSRSLRLWVWFAPVPLLSPYFWFYARVLWDNPFLIPLGALAIAGYAAHLNSGSAGWAARVDRRHGRRSRSFISWASRSSFRLRPTSPSCGGAACGRTASASR